MTLDLIVVGGGPVGLSMACAAQGLPGGLRVALVAQERPQPVAGNALDARVYALSPANVAFLRELRVWERLDATRLTPVHGMRVYGDGEGASIDFDAYRAGVPELAWTVEDAGLQEALWRAIEGRAGVELLAPAECEALDGAADSIRLRLRDGRRLEGALAIGADGAGSFVRTQAGIAISASEYGQAAVVANFACEKAHANVACQWFQGGPVLALLPLPGRRVSMIWSVPAAEAARLVGLDATALCRKLAEETRGELGGFELLTPARSYPLRRLSARRLVARRVALVGDAAHVIHPLAGQGLNLGLQDVRELAALLAARPLARDPGDEGLLRAYERKRAEPILAMDFTVDGLYRLFGARGMAAARLRNAGLNLTNRLPVLKNLLIRRAMG